jgi:hypothetical protein
MENGKWRMEDGKWRMENGKWRKNEKYSSILISLYDFIWCAIRIIAPQFAISFAIILIAFQRESYRFTEILL